jgi:uncharacterized protein
LKDLVWEKLDGLGYEHLKVFDTDSGYRVDSLIIVQHLNSIQRVHYEATLDSGWAMETVKITLVNQSKSLYLQTDGNGLWFDKDLDEIPALQGCRDIDISATPFTNSLPIKRVGWRLNEQQDFHMVYISVPNLSIKKVKQTYTLKEENNKSKKYNYESNTFTSEIEVDSDGFVLDYPTLFVRRY